MGNPSKSRFYLAFLAAIFTPAMAHAHTGLGTLSGFGDGFGHPLAGIDHLLTMFAVGIWAFQSGGRSVWALPVSFVSIMVVGGFWGFSGVGLPYVEQGILTSVLVFGLLIALAVRLPLAFGMIATGVFALFHGHSHGTEMPATASGLAYGAGFVLATSALHLGGIALASAATWARYNTVVTRFAGAAVAVAGLVYLL